jgi:hypothetical protein
MGWRVAKAVKRCRQGPLSLVDAIQVAATLGALGELPARFPYCHIATSRERIHGYLAECICGAFVHAGIEIPDTLYADLASYA